MPDVIRKKHSAITDVTAENRITFGFSYFRLYCFCEMLWQQFTSGMQSSRR